MGQKRVQLLHEAVPKATAIGVLVNPTGPNLNSVMQDVRIAGRELGLSLQVLNASSERDLEAVFASLSRLRIGALVIGVDTFFNSQSRKLAELTTRHAVPAVYQYREFAAAGGMLSYGGSITDAYRMAGNYVGRILKGEKPTDLPVQQSSKVELFVNRKAAAALGISIPPSILLRADEVID